MQKNIKYTLLFSVALLFTACSILETTNLAGSNIDNPFKEVQKSA